MTFFHFLVYSRGAYVRFFENLKIGVMRMYRCQWSGNNENMQVYHDTVWGTPEYDDQRLFRKLVLDMNQAGLSWQTILNKMDNLTTPMNNLRLKRLQNLMKQRSNR